MQLGQLITGFPVRRTRNKTMETVKTISERSNKRGTKRTTMDKMFREQNNNKKPSRIKIMEVYDFPKQFLLRSEVLSDPEDYVTIDSEDRTQRSKSRLKSGRLRPKLPDKHSDYLDLDFMMPTQVREILLEEGLSKEVIDSTLGVDEKQHRKIMQLTLLAEKYKRFPQECKTTSTTDIKPKTFHSLYHEQDQIGCKSCSDVRARQERRNTRTRPWKETNIPDTMSSNEETNESSGEKVEETFFLTDAEKIRWSADQEEERVLMGNHFDPPRVVLISSKVPKKHLIPKLFHDNKRILQIVYDFDTWSFSDINDAIQKRLDSVKPACKAKSVILFCQGGSGFLYLLRKYVVTPQKMHKESYQDVREFWKRLGSQISKLCQGESKINIVCKNVSEGRQGKEVIRSIQRLVHSDMVKVEVVDNTNEQGLKILDLYFNVDRFNLWSESMDDSDNEIDFSILDEKSKNCQIDDDKDIPRTISSLAAEVENESS
ncbi:NSMF [Mytilus edulis]|uniref:NSMF n=1 Tax=Mytilus edulis TaxID=6550 RepID=A0A8S3TFN9_MYTED|nr:NSMF [Mytilus edulis]